jgi:hypothetical protein
MKQELTYNEMSCIMGGSDFLDGACAVVGIARLLTPFLAFTAVGLIVVRTASAACAIYAVTRLD